MVTAVYLILAAGITPAVIEFVTLLRSEWVCTRRRRLTVLRRLGRAA